MSPLEYTPVEEIDKIHARLRSGFNTGSLKSIEFRKYLLIQLAYLLKDNATRFEDALESDLGRPRIETDFLEIGPTLNEVKSILADVDSWAKTESPPFTLIWGPMRPSIRKEAKGVVMVISPFNYPIWLSLGPVLSAISAGCTVLLKPSEATPACSALFAELFPKYIDPQFVSVVNGAIPETTKLLALQWDHILFTGSGRVGKVVAAAAAKYMTPITLELGGKSPVFIDPKVDVKMAARRILLGKCVNAGQTCVAPDYIIVPRDFQDTFVDALKEAHSQFYPLDQAPSVDGNMSRLVSPQAFTRVSTLLKNTEGTVVLGGEMDEGKKFIAPTVVRDVKANDSLMSEEIFGPVLPIMPVDTIEDGIAYVNANDHPLALYVFSSNSAFKAKVFDNTTSGAAVANEVGIHPGADGIPFGGIGPSGSGFHTGKYGFDTFTHLRASMDPPTWVDKILAFRFPPYSEKSAKMARRIYPSLPTRPSGPPGLKAGSTFLNRWVLLGLAVAIAGIVKQKQLAVMVKAIRN